ncbi:hypothetical protein [Cellvibrio sp. BR]|uniref:hypothetical protein n=1 Tax=Cellvibrio sp. BR TaxID=1134474 RepID=UPI00059039E7|nr:hypothetical protein [Cellvibrio sp. BR]
MINIIKYQEEREQHLNFFNTVAGGFSFTISLACLQMSNTEVAVMICAPFVFSLVIMGLKKYPKSMQDLRRKAKNDKKAEELNKHIYSTEYGKKALLLHYFPYVYGYGFFVLTFAFPGYMKNLVNG